MIFRELFPYSKLCTEQILYLYSNINYKLDDNFRERLYYIKRNSKCFYPMGNISFKTQKKLSCRVVRNCEISITMDNRINKCNMSISTLLFFFSMYSSGTQELHPHKNRKSGNLAKTQCIHRQLCRTNSTYNYSSYFPCIVRGQKESTDTVPLSVGRLN